MVNVYFWITQHRLIEGLWLSLALVFLIIDTVDEISVLFDLESHLEDSFEVLHYMRLISHFVGSLIGSSYPINFLINMSQNALELRC